MGYHVNRVRDEAIGRALQLLHECDHTNPAVVAVRDALDGVWLVSERDKFHTPTEEEIAVTLSVVETQLRSGVISWRLINGLVQFPSPHHSGMEYRQTGGRTFLLEINGGSGNVHVTDYPVVFR